MSKNYIYAVAILVGAITGAGIFAMPYVITRAGVIPFLLFLPLLVAAQCLIHILYAKVILSTKTEHRIPGYVEVYGGMRWKKLVSFFCLLGGYGSLLAYIILGGNFLSELLMPYFGGDQVLYASLLFVVEAAIVFAGLKMIAGTESFLTAILLLVFAVLTVKCFGHLSLGNFSTVNWVDVFLPYGPIFFAIGGDAAVPEVCRILDKEKKKIHSALIWGTVISAVIMAAFALAVAGVTGANTTPDALAGLKAYFGNGITTAALIFGLLCIITSCLVYMQAVREIYWWDFKMNKNLAWFLAAFIPFGFFLLGLKNVTEVVALTGLVTGGVLGIILILLTMAVDKYPEKKSPIGTKTSKALAIILCSLFILGFLSELATMIF